jgi:hypothetical protein
LYPPVSAYPLGAWCAEWWQRIALAIGWRWLAGAILIRVVLSPLQHTWDSQTWLDVASELGRDANPLTAVAAVFEHTRELSDLVRGAGLRSYYEYWAYPPMMLLAWWPIARVWSIVVGPVPFVVAAPDAFVASSFPPLLALGLKVPTILGDIVAGLILARLTHRSVGRWYLFNPYVLLVGVWSFDGIMTAFVLAALWAAERHRWVLAGTLLGLGATVKFVPALLVACVMYSALHVAAKPIRSAGKVGLAAIGTIALVCAPWLDGVGYVLDFHSARPGGGMSWQNVWGTVAWRYPHFDLAPILLYGSPQLGMLTLSGALLVAMWLVWWRQLDVVSGSLVLLLAYLTGSKLVNEVYSLPALAAAAVIAWRRPTVGQTELRRWLWVVPLAFAAVNVPAWGFLVAPGISAGLFTPEDVRTFYAGYVGTYDALSPVLSLSGILFQVLCIWGVWLLCRSGPVVRPDYVD